METVECRRLVDDLLISLRKALSIYCRAPGFSRMLALHSALKYAARTRPPPGCRPPCIEFPGPVLFSALVCRTVTVHTTNCRSAATAAPRPSPANEHIHGWRSAAAYPLPSAAVQPAAATNEFTHRSTMVSAARRRQARRRTTVPARRVW